MDQYLSLQCIVTDGDLPIDIMWTFNNEPITSEQPDVVVAKMGKRSSLLTIESVSARNDGKYLCQAENKAGHASYVAELKVIGSLIKTICL